MSDTMMMTPTGPTSVVATVATTEDMQAIPGSPWWWLERLTCQLLRDQPRMVLMDRYYRGDHPLPFVPRELRDEYRRMLADARLNFMRIVVTSPAERLRVQGFRPRGAAAVDDDAWSWWLDNGLDSDSNLTIVNALAMGRGYVFLEGTGDGVVARAEDPRMAMVAYDPQDRHRRVAGLRLWFDDWVDRVRADVWLEDAVYQFVATADKVRSLKTWPTPWTPASPVNETEARFVKVFDREEAAATFNEWSSQWLDLDFARNPSREIPLVPLVNQPSTLAMTDGESELDDVYLTQNRINELIFDRQLAAWTAAYQQKWATGIDIPRDPKTGDPVQPFKSAIDRLWADTNEQARFGAFPATDLSNYIKAIEADVKHLAVVTRTPRHYLVESGQTPSGDSIKSAESGLVAKVGEKQIDYGRSFAEVIRVRRAMAGDSERPVETVWADPEFRTLAELTDAVIKQNTAGLIPRRVARERLGYSPSEIARMERLDMTEGLIAEAQAAALPSPAVTATPAQPPSATEATEGG